MILLDAKVYLYKLEDSSHARTHGIRSDGLYHPSINFGDVYLSSGSFFYDKNLDFALLGVWYRVIIVLPLIENEVLSHG